MLNELSAFIRRQDLVTEGDRVYCAVSGGADSMALLWGLYLLRDKLSIDLRAVHFNHGLRGEESDRDEAHVRDFCQGYGIPLTVGSARVRPGKKGLEAAAREARYAFFDALDGKIATAHTANDNAETVLMHLVRGTGLKGLGGIAPVRGKIIRPLLSVTRQQVLSFLEEYAIPYVYDSSNGSDAFLRNRLRAGVMPALYEENPCLAQSLSAMALRLRQDEQALQALIPTGDTLSVAELRRLPPALRSRALHAFLERCGVREPEASHVALAESLVLSENPSAKACFPGGITLTRCYDTLQSGQPERMLPCIPLPGQGRSLMIPELSLVLTWDSADTITQDTGCYTVHPVGQMVIRCRKSGDTIRTPGGTKTLKKLFIDKKIPAARRDLIPVIADDLGVLGVYGIGVNLDRAADSLPAVRIRFSQSMPAVRCEQK